MPELPASVRLSLWVTQAWASGASLEKAIGLAMPDVDHVAGDLAQLGLWRDLGEQALHPRDVLSVQVGYGLMTEDDGDWIDRG